MLARPLPAPEIAEGNRRAVFILKFAHEASLLILQSGAHREPAMPHGKQPGIQHDWPTIDDGVYRIEKIIEHAGFKAL